MEDNKRNIDFLFIIGVVFIFVGLTLCISLFFLILGFPVYLIGAICVGFSKKSSELKLRWILIPFASYGIFIWALYAFYNQSDRTNPRDILIPEGYRGKIYIIFEQPCGVEISEENGREIYKIPESGVLICKNKEEKGITDYNYFFISDSGERRAIPYNYTDSENRNTVIIQGAGNGTVSGTDVPQHTYESFIVTSIDSLKKFDIFGWRSNKKIDSIKVSILNDCIGK